MLISMSKTWLILVTFLATLLASHTHVSSQPIVPTFTFSFCRNFEFGNYTTNSTYERNLKTVLSTLEEHASTEPFYNTSTGNGTNTVHGQYYCRGDVDSSFCSQCIKQAAQKALNCSNAKGAIIWYEECTLRYMNKSMHGVSEDHLVLYSYSLRNLTDPEFSSILNDTVNNLIQEVAYGNNGSINYFATEEKKVSSFITAYFLVQCSLDLNQTQCESCLLSAFKTTKTCCGEWPLVLYSFAPSCQVMYNTDGIFYFTTNAPPPPPSFSSPTPPPPPLSIGSEPPPPPQVTILPTPTTPKTGGSAMIRNSMRLGFVPIALVLFMLFFDNT